MHPLQDPSLSRAVLIGTSAFEHLPSLPAVRNNLSDLSAALTDRQFGILSGDGCTIVDSPETVGSFLRRLRVVTREANDLLLVYYAGHGLRHPTRDLLYLAVEGTDPDEPEGTAVRFDAVREIIEDSPARKRLLILDCCYSGMALGTMSGGGIDPREVAVGGTAVITSSPKNKISHSPVGQRLTAFSGELISLMVGGSPVPDEALTVDTAFRSLVAALARRRLPEPKLKLTDTSGQILLRRAPPPPPQPPPPKSSVASRMPSVPAAGEPPSSPLPPTSPALSPPAPEPQATELPSWAPVSRQMLYPSYFRDELSAPADPVAPTVRVPPEPHRTVQEPSPTASDLASSRRSIGPVRLLVDLSIRFALWFCTALGAAFGVGGVVGSLVSATTGHSPRGTDVGFGIGGFVFATLLGWILYAGHQRLRRAAKRRPVLRDLGSPAVMVMARVLLVAGLLICLGSAAAGLASGLQATSGPGSLSSVGTAVYVNVFFAEGAAACAYRLFRWRRQVGRGTSPPQL